MDKKRSEADELPAGLAAPAVRALNGAGYTKIEQLAKATEADLMKLHGMGPNAMKTLKEALKARNLKLADSD